MSPKPSLRDTEGPPSNKNDIRPLGTSLHGAEAVTPNEATLTDMNTTANNDATVDAAVTTGKAATAQPGLHSHFPQPTKLTSVDIECGATRATESFIPTSSSSHSSDKPLKISDLPNELLNKIMFHVSGRAEKCISDNTTLDFLSTANQDIKNARLSCRTLSAPASEYLIDLIRVDVSESSLARFEQVSKHPDIGRGVRAVQVCLAQYDDGFENNLEGFIRYHKNEIDHVWEYDPEMYSEIEPFFHAWGKYLEALAAEDHNLPAHLEIQEVGCVQALLEGYRLYQGALQEQKLLQDGSFVSRVSASIANLPVVKHLELTDWDIARWGRREESGCRLDPSSNESIVHSLAEFRNPFSEIKGNSFLHFVPNLICANITSLVIRVSPRVGKYTELSLSSLQEDQLRSNLRKLRSFKFEIHDWFPPHREMDHPGFRSLARFLDACLESESLEHLCIRAQQCGSSGGSLISPRPWPRLKSAMLLGVPVSGADLDFLTRSIASQPKGSLALVLVHLYCGATWASVLDMLRDRRIDVSLQHPGGAEIESNPYVRNVFAGNFRSWLHALPSFAEFYIQGEDMPNPILEPPSQELRHRLLGPVPSDDGDVDFDFDFDFP